MLALFIARLMGFQDYSQIREGAPIIPFPEKALGAHWLIAKLNSRSCVHVQGRTPIPPEDGIVTDQDEKPHRSLSAAHHSRAIAVGSPNRAALVAAPPRLVDSPD
jgi:hypothetical protein